MTIQDYFGSGPISSNAGFSTPGTFDYANQQDWQRMWKTDGQNYLDTQYQLNEELRKMRERGMLQSAQDKLAFVKSFQQSQMRVGQPVIQPQNQGFTYGQSPYGPGFASNGQPRINIDSAPRNPNEARLQALLQNDQNMRDRGFTWGTNQDITIRDKQRKDAQENLKYQSELAAMKDRARAGDQRDEQFQQSLDERAANHQAQIDFKNRQLDSRNQNASDNAAGKDARSIGKLQRDIGVGIQSGAIDTIPKLDAVEGGNLNSYQYTYFLDQLGKTQKGRDTQVANDAAPILQHLNDQMKPFTSAYQQATDKANSEWDIPFLRNSAEDANKARAIYDKQTQAKSDLLLNDKNAYRDIATYDPQAHRFIYKAPTPLPTQDSATAYSDLYAKQRANAQAQPQARNSGFVYGPPAPPRQMTQQDRAFMFGNPNYSGNEPSSSDPYRFGGRPDYVGGGAQSANQSPPYPVQQGPQPKYNARGVRVLQDPSEWNDLAPGTPYIDPSGVLRQKPR